MVSNTANISYLTDGGWVSIGTCNVSVPNYFDVVVTNKNRLIPEVDRVIFSPPATIVFWKDGSKTVVKTSPDEEYVEEWGFAACVMKKLFGTRSKYMKMVKKGYRPQEVKKDEE